VSAATTRRADDSTSSNNTNPRLSFPLRRDETGDERRERDEQQHLRVQPEISPERRLPGKRSANHDHAHLRDDRADGSRDERQHDGFDDELAGDGRARRAQGNANCDLFRSVRRAGQQQVRDVGARDEKDQADGAEHRVEQPNGAHGNGGANEWLHHADNSFVRFEMFPFDAFRDPHQFSIRLLIAHAVTQPPDAIHVRSGPPRERGGIQAQRYPDPRIARIAESLGHHSDHGRRLSVHPDGATEDVRVAGVSVAPERIGQNGDELTTRDFIVGAKRSSEHRTNVREIHRGGGDTRGVDAVGLFVVRDVDRRRHPRTELDE
jgi:hypothetical protein